MDVRRWKSIIQKLSVKIRKLSNRTSTALSRVRALIFMHPGIPLVCVTVISLAASYMFAKIDLRLPEGGLHPLSILLLFLLAVFLPAAIVIWASTTAFRHSRRANALVTLLLSYFVIVTTAAGFYYSILYMEDFNVCVSEYYTVTFHHNNRETAEDIMKDVKPRALSGFRERFWTLEYFELDDKSNSRNSVGNKADVDELIKKESGVELPIFVECLHFSVLSSSFIGSSSVEPHDWKIKLGNTIQILASTFLALVVLGIVLQDREDRPEPATKAK